MRDAFKTGAFAGKIAEAPINSRLTLRGYGEKRDIAEVAMFLCTNNAKYSTDSIIDYDGGSNFGDAPANTLEVRGA